MRVTRAIPTRVCALGADGGGLAGVQYCFELSAGGTLGLIHRSGRVRGKNAVLT